MKCLKKWIKLDNLSETKTESLNLFYPLTLKIQLLIMKAKLSILYDKVEGKIEKVLCTMLWAAGLTSGSARGSGALSSKPQWVCEFLRASDQSAAWCLLTGAVGGPHLTHMEANITRNRALSEHGTWTHSCEQTAIKVCSSATANFMDRGIKTKQNSITYQFLTVLLQ